MECGEAGLNTSSTSKSNVFASVARVHPSSAPKHPAQAARRQRPWPGLRPSALVQRLLPRARPVVFGKQIAVGSFRILVPVSFVP